MYYSLFSVYSLLLLSVIPSSHSIKLFLSTGAIEGKTLTSTYSPFGNQTARVFLGIPYASPPLGQLRFKKPRGMAVWQGVMHTKEYRPACMSDAKKTYKNDVGGPVSEDCLYLNVFTNDYCLKNKSCAVLVVIHGGKFLYESAATFNPQILVNNFVGQGRNIVVVTINYRLGIFGLGQFNGDSGSSGDRNLALWDALAAVKWVRREIGAFGGDKNRITVGGHSAGAALTFEMSASPQSHGLFKQQLLMSALLPNLSKRNNFKATTAAAMYLGCLKEEFGFEKLPKAVMEETFKCLRNLPAQQLLDAQYYTIKNTTYFWGCPYVDGEFITDYPDRLFNNRKISPITTLLGSTSAEMRETRFLVEPENSSRKPLLLENICELIGYEVFSEPRTFSRECLEYYSRANYSQFLSDDYEFYSGVVNVANSHLSRRTKVFVYDYQYAGAGRAFAKFGTWPDAPHHSEDFIYVFGTHRAVMTPKDYEIERIYSGLYANFINFGDPSPSKDQQWTPYSKENREHFVIDFDADFTMPGMREGYYKRAVDFWINRNYTRHHKETWAPSLDTQVITTILNPIRSHLAGDTANPTDDKSFELNEQLFEEREQFLRELKGTISMRSEVFKEEGGINILLLIFAGTLIIGILYLTITHCWIHRSRKGYQLLKGTNL